jgi:hypothetical protein
MAVIDEQRMQEARELRSRGFAARGIARKLGIRPAEAAELVRRIAVERDAVEGDGDIASCLISAGWSTGLSIAGEHPDWHDRGGTEGTDGLVTVLLARQRPHRRAATVCVYLLDVYCLGVKNAMGPDRVEERALRALTDRVFGAYRSPPVPAPIMLARELVFGAVEYAHRLGFSPHPDFEQTRAHLGQWSGPSAITFGRDGKPTYVQGPYEDSERVLSTLHRKVGRKGFHYTVALDLDESRLAS